MFNLGPSGLQQLPVLNSSWARCLASKAAQAIAHFLRKFGRRFQGSIGHAAHEGDPASRAVALPLGGVVGGAGRQTRAAMHALLQNRVIQFG